MSNLPTTEEELKEFRSQVFDELEDAKAKKDQAAITAARQLLKKTDEALDDLSLLTLASFAAELKSLQAKLDEAKKKATLLGGLKDLAKPPKPPQQTG